MFVTTASRNLDFLTDIHHRWDTLSGRKSTSPPTAPESSGTLDTRDSFQPAPFDPTTAQDVSSFLTDAAALHPLANLNQDTLDYLTLEDSVLSDLPGSRSALPSRGWSDDLCYGTGTTYLAALSLGGAWGLAEGWNKAPVSATPRLRLNYVLNAVTRRGPFLGNSAGVVAMMYNGVNSTIGYWRGKRKPLIFSEVKYDQFAYLHQTMLPTASLRVRSVEWSLRVREESNR